VKKAVLALTALVAIGVLLVVLRGPTVRTGGPVSGGLINRSQPIDAGVDESFGYLLKNEGEEPAILERVRIVGVTGPIEVLGVRARFHKGDQGSLIMLAGFPPPEYPSRPLAEEHVVPVPGGSPDEALQLVVGVRATGEGFGRIRGIEFTYRVGHQRYRNSNYGHGSLCTPQKRFYDLETRGLLEECPSKDVSEAFDKKFVDFVVPAKGASS
jgi:hypothetical protein